MKRAAVLAVLSLNLVLPALGAPPSGADPETLIRSMSEDVLGAARADPEIASGGPKALRLAEERIFPLVDFEEATRLAVGRPWKQASAAQQARLVAEFRTLLVRTMTLGQRYVGQTVTVLPVHIGPADTEATVRNRCVRPGASALRIDFQMHRTGAGWRIYDVAVDGVSLVLAYRAEFETIIRRQGIDGLIRSLAEKNRHVSLTS